MDISCLDKFCTAKGLSFESFDLAQEKWQKILDNCSLYPTEYDSFILRYFDVRHSGEQDFYQNLSSVVLQDGKPIAVWPLVVKQKDGISMLGSNGGNLIAPLYEDGISSKVLKKLNTGCLEIARNLSRHLRIASISTRAFNYGAGISDWQRLWLNEGASCHQQYMLYVDLGKSLESIKANFRKSYRPLVNKGLKQWKVEVVTSEGGSSFEEFKALHIAESGRQTRSDGTWNSQYQAIQNGSAFLVLLRDAQHKLVGGGMFYFNRTMALYAVGAYERALFKEPLGHVVQYKAMEYLIDKGVKLYCIGHRPYAQDFLEPTQKEVSIGQFKEGFATDTFINSMLTLSYEH